MEIDKLFQTVTGELAPNHILVVELSPDDWGETVFIEASRFKTPQDFEDQFSQILKSGFSWINLSYRGDISGRPIVAIELPKESVGAKFSSVNYSGPTKAVLAAGGDASSEIQVDGDFPEID